MAIWQFDLALIPSGGSLPLRSPDGHDCPPLSPENALRAHSWLCDRAGEPWLMSEGWLVFGAEQESRFDLLFDDDGGAELSARIDVRSAYQSFVTGVCELASAIQCTLFSIEHWMAIEPIEEELRRAVESSRAAAFVRDPLDVLRGVHDAG